MLQLAALPLKAESLVQLLSSYHDHLFHFNYAVFLLKHPIVEAPSKAEIFTTFAD
jgi:hypothetical protein